MSASAIDTSHLIKTFGDDRAVERLRRRAARAATRKEFARRRAHGMIDRQAQRLSRVRGPAPPDRQ